MDDRTAASVGLLFACLAFGAAIVGRLEVATPAALVGVAAAAVAAAAFGTRRFGALDRRPAAAIAAAGSLGVAVVGVFLTFRGDSLLPLLAAATGGLGAAFAYADWRGLGRGTLADLTETTFRGVTIGAAGILAIVAWAIVVGVLLPVGDDAVTRTVLNTLASGAGTLTVVAIYLRWSERDVAFLDLHAPGLRGLAYAIGGAVAILGGNLAIGLAFQRAGVESASHTIIRTAQTDPTVLLALVPLAYLVIAPGEELLYRNVVQKTLRESFSPVAGVVVASAIFAAVHLPAYSNPGGSFLATVNTLVIIFVLALILGAIYERTGNVVVPIIAHGTFNAVAFAITYAQLTGAIGG